MCRSVKACKGLSSNREVDYCRARMSIDIVKQYVQLRNQLVEEKTRLETRLGQINRVLGGEIPIPAKTESGPTTERTDRASGRRRIKNPMSLRKAIVQVTAANPLTKEEILDAVEKLGYQFGTDKPILSINPILYGKNPKFKRNGGKFSPAK